MDGSMVMPVRSLYLVRGELDVVPEGVGLYAQVVPGPEAVGRGLDDPVDVDADQVQELAAHHGDLGRVDAVGAVDGAAAALGALVEIVEPFLENVLGQVARAREPSEDLSRRVK